jgi:hypothetical protein
MPLKVTNPGSACPPQAHMLLEDERAEWELPRGKLGSLKPILLSMYL